MKTVIVYIFLILCGTISMQMVSAATPPVGVAYWDVDALYDTIPSRFYDDSHYTPRGRYRWTTERYLSKVRSVVEVIDSMRMPILAISGVESEAVVRDIVSTSSLDYVYLHRTFSSVDGLEVALLYYGDMFEVEFSRVESRSLYVEGVLGVEESRSGGNIKRCRVGIWIAMSSYEIESFEPPHKEALPDIMVIMGRVSHEALMLHGVCDPLSEDEREGRGNISSRRGWYLRDRIALSPQRVLHTRGIYIRRWMLDPQRGVPQPTFRRDEYTAGASQSLPIYLYFSISAL